jgi:uncharacterized membrane protein YidH (DUF202 family)
VRILGIALIVIGLVTLVFGGVIYKREQTDISFGPIDAKVTEQKKLPIPPVIGVIAIVAGVAVLVVKR